MKTSKRKRVILAAFIVLATALAGCKPSVREVAKVISTVPLGVSRDEVRKVLVDAYGKKYTQLRQEYALVEPPYPVAAGLIKADTDLLNVFNKGGLYTRVYPSDLFEKIPSGSVTERIGLVAWASSGDDEINIFYDSNTNYIGFFAYSTGKR